MQWTLVALALAATTGALWCSVLFSRVFLKHSSKVITRCVGVAVAIPLGALTLFLALFASEPQMQPSPIRSPDGNHTASIDISPGSAVDADTANVYVRGEGLNALVYSGVGFYAKDKPIEPRVSWIDNGTVLVDYPDEPERKLICDEHVAGIKVVCKAHRN